MKTTFRWTLALLLLSVAYGVSAETLRMKFTFADAEVGTNVFERKEDGTFTSRSDITIAGTQIVSDLSGKYADGRLIEYTLKQKLMGTEVTVTYAGGKVKVSTAGQSREAEVKMEKELFFANYHPQIGGALLKAIGGQTPAEKQPIMIMDSGTILPITFTVQPGRVVRRGNANVTVNDLKLDFGTVALTYAIDAQGRVAGWDVPTQMFRGVLEGWSEVFSDPTARYPELSQATFKTRVERGVKIRMRDGVELTADLLLPEGEGKFPTILVRTPYGRANEAIKGEWWAKRGYAYLAQDCRGRHDSGGEWDPFMNERKDGYDTLDWIAKQSWSNGSVGMIGGSYGGLVQWTAAVERHPALKAIVPQVAPPDGFYNIPYDHGIFFLWGNLWWANLVKERQTRMELAGRPLPGTSKLTTLPLSKVDDEVLGVNIPFFDKWLERDRPAAFAGFNYQADMPRVTIPALHISGWWDGDGIGTKRNWEIMRAAKRTNQWLIYGPWSHAFNSSSRFGDQDYGPDAILELDSLYLRWFDTWLKGKQVDLQKVPRVQVFVTGANEWRFLQDWPDPRSKEKTLYLGATGPANGKTSMGQLLENPVADAEPSRYTYNPASAVIPEEILKANPTDPSASSTIVKIEDKDQDSLVYRSDPMKEPMEIGGPISLDLYFSTSARDTDFFAMLVDIDEKGVMGLIGMPGKINGRFVQGWKEPKLLTPNRVYRTTIDLWDTAHRFKTGHRIGVILTSSMFPTFARNLNTGEPIKDAVRMVAAHQTIYHDKARPSALRFRLLPPR